MPAVVHVSAPSRLHWGMFSFGRPDVRQFGGVGVMIDRPRLELRISAASGWQASGPGWQRAVEFARRAAAHWGLPAGAGGRIEVLEAPPAHVGLGSGTQMGLAVAAGISTLFGRPTEPWDLACAVGRGARSNVGLLGFWQGGLIVEAGKRVEGGPSPLVARVELPAAWRFILIRPAGEAGLSGGEERRAFERLPPVPAEVTARLCEEVVLRLAPAAREGDFEGFAESVARFGRAAGSAFAAVQQGPFARPDLVAWLATMGVRGVAQSSWGPTVSGLAPNPSEAEETARRIVAEKEELSVVAAAADNRGAAMVEESA
jgi:beta-RFAP synthase